MAMIDLIQNLNNAALVATSPRQSTAPLDERTEAAKIYPWHLEKLHLYTSDVIDATLQQYNRHIDQFLRSVESFHEDHALKAFFIKFPILEGIRAIATSAFLQGNAENKEFESIRDKLKFNFIIASDYHNLSEDIPNSIVHHAQNRIDFVPILERLCKIAESETQIIPVRNLAILAMETICAEGVQSFNLRYDRESLDTRMIDLGMNTKDPSLTMQAIEFVDGRNPTARMPSQP